MVLPSHPQGASFGRYGPWSPNLASHQSPIRKQFSKLESDPHSLLLKFLNNSSGPQDQGCSENDTMHSTVWRACFPRAQGELPADSAGLHACTHAHFSPLSPGISQYLECPPHASVSLHLSDQFDLIRRLNMTHLVQAHPLWVPRPGPCKYL